MSETVQTKGRSIRDLVQLLAGTFLKDVVSLEYCRVDSVDSGQRTCDVTPITGKSDTPITGVRLIAEIDDGILIIPKIDSTVAVAFSIRNDAYVAMFSAIDSVTVVADKFRFNRGQNGGLVNIENLIQQLNDQLSELKTAITSAYSAQSVFDASAGLNAWNAAKTAIQDLSKTGLEDSKVIH